MNATNSSPSVFGGDDRPLYRIIVYGLSLAFSTLIASLQTVRVNATGFWFDISWRTAVVFLLAGAFMLPCFNMIFHSRSMKRRVLGLVVVALTGIFGFFYPMRFVPVERYGMLVTGLVSAVIALSGVAAMIFTLSRALEADDRRNSGAGGE